MEKELDYATAIRDLRDRYGWTLGRLAGVAGLSGSYLSEVERGLKRPSADTLKRLAGAFGMQLSQLVALVEQLPGPPAAASAGAQGPVPGGYAVPAQVPGAQEPGEAWSAHSSTLVFLARELGHDDRRLLIELARRLLRDQAR